MVDRDAAAAGFRIGIDLGGTKIEGIVLGDDGAEWARLRVPTPRESYEATVEAVAGVVRELENRVGSHCPVGVGHPGAVSPATGLEGFLPVGPCP